MFILNGFDEKTKKDFDEKSAKWLGAENSGSIFNFATEAYLENPEKVIVPIQLTSSYNSKKFETDEKAFENSIRKCYLGIPSILVSDKDGGVFGTSGTAIKEAQRMYSNETNFLRDRISEIFIKITGIENSIIPLI
jgi:glutaredoxin-related protein